MRGEGGGEQVERLGRGTETSGEVGEGDRNKWRGWGGELKQVERLGRGTEASGEVGEGDRSRWRGFGILSSVYVHNIAIKNIIVQRLSAKDF